MSPVLFSRLPLQQAGFDPYRMAGTRFLRGNPEFDFGVSPFIKVPYPFIFVQEIAKYGLDLSAVFIVHLTEIRHAHDPHGVAPLQRNTVPINSRVWRCGCHR